MRSILIVLCLGVGLAGLGLAPGYAAKRRPPQVASRSRNKVSSR